MDILPLLIDTLKDNFTGFPPSRWFRGYTGKRVTRSQSPRGSAAGISSSTRVGIPVMLLATASLRHPAVPYSIPLRKMGGRNNYYTGRYQVSLV